MNEYRIEYVCSDGFEGEEIVSAANRIMAFEIFASFDIPDVVIANAFRILE